VRGLTSQDPGLVAHLHGQKLVELRGEYLVQMMFHVHEVICREKTKRNGLGRTDAARSFKFGRWKMGDHVSQEAIVISPQGNEERPTCLLNGLRFNIASLVVTREIQRRLKSGANETLMIVGR